MLTAYRWKQVCPFRVETTNQANLPASIPFLQLFLTTYSFIDVIARFVVDQPMYAILLSETTSQITHVLAYSADEISRHSHVERTVLAAGHDVDKCCFHMSGFNKHIQTDRQCQAM